MELYGVEGTALGQASHRRFRQAWKGEPPNGRRRRQVSEHDAQRMGRTDLVVPVGDDQQEARGAAAPAHEAQEVERRLVRPVGVLEHGERRAEPAGELSQNGAKDPMPGLPRVREEPLEGPTHGGGDVEHRGQRAWRRHGIAGPDEHSRGVPGGFGDPANERGLAHARLAAHEDEVPASGRRIREQAVELS